MALEFYNEVTTLPNYSLEVHVYRALCLYKTGNGDEARKELSQAPNSTLNSRLKFHMSQTSGDDDNMVSYNLLNDTSENLLCMASVHFERKN